VRCHRKRSPVTGFSMICPVWAIWAFLGSEIG
jgi:hypothetical protein